MAEQKPIGTERRKQLFLGNPAQTHLLLLLTGFVLAGMLVFLVLSLITGNDGQLSLVAIFLNLLLAMILIMIGVAFLGLRYSNKIMGPIVNFGRNLQFIHQGDYTHKVQLRHGDEFQNMAGVFNQALESLRTRVQEDLAFADRLIVELEAAAASDAKARTVLQEVKDYRANKERYLQTRT
ncbi:MAG: methyl-accepting chemotaxis protein [Myxococcales bacterium]|nr:methyl-accepting chemotaxis protein [Myxococcales bacterium]